MSFLTDLLILVIALNPSSKALLSSQLSRTIKDKKHITDIINYSNAIGLGLIILFALVGPFVFKTILGISDSALIIACGLSLSIFGLNYLFKEEIFSIQTKSKSIIYLSIGMPMIVGPASISIITLISSYSSFLYSFILCLIAMLINYLFMIFSYKYLSSNSKNENLHYLNIKLTGILMLAVGIQFLLNVFQGNI
ncbi:MAG: MarC family protein [Candidatus Nanoarchaeia archaeon]|nr:MarC family protein [Candidatus Nanoarchaeia archaeon]